MNVDLVVYGDGQRLIASPEAAYVFHLDVFGTHAGKPAQEFGAKIARAVQVAAHVVAQANFRLGGRSQMEVRVKAGNTVKLVERSLRAFRKGL
jgi:hypothetical protein